MGQTALVESQIVDSLAVVRNLDATGTPPSFAAWYYYSDADEWRLVLAAKAFDGLLAKEEATAYRKVVEAMNTASLASMAVSQIKLVRTDDVLPKALRMLIRTGPNDLFRSHFTDTTINGIFIKEMVILRSA
jgi:hypothetical protein